MTDTWARFVDYAALASGAEAGFAIDPASRWVEGHFPGDPTVPALAMLACVQDVVARWARANGHDVRLNGLHKVRFRKKLSPPVEFGVRLEGLRPGTPDARFDLVLRGAGDASGSFCSGSAALEWRS